MHTTNELTTKQLWHMAYSAARAALANEWLPYSVRIAAPCEDSYPANQVTLWRYKLTCAAASAAQMNRGHRKRASVRLLHSSALTLALMNYRAGLWARGLK